MDKLNQPLGNAKAWRIDEVLSQEVAQHVLTSNEMQRFC